MTRINPPGLKTKLSLIYPFAVVFLSLGVLIGWHFDIEALRKMLPHGVSVNPLTAILFLLSSFVITLNFILKKETKASGIFAAIVLCTGLLKLISYIGHFDLGIDQLFYRSMLNEELANGYSNQIAPNTALNFFLLGIALQTYRKNNRLTIITDVSCIVIIFTSFLSLIGYIYGAKELYGVSNFVPMAVLTAICFLLSSTALLLNRQASFILKILSGQNAGSRMARYLLPMAIIFPILLGLLRLQGFNAGLFSKEIGAAIFAASNIMVFSLLILNSASSINKSQSALQSEIAERMRVEENLRASEALIREFNRQLENKVEERTAQLKKRSKMVRSLVEKKMLLDQKLLQEKIDKQIQITQATIYGQEKERKEIGMELHDNVNQMLAASKLYLDLAESKPEVMKELITRSRKGIADAIQEIRKLSKSMVPPMMGVNGIIDCIEEFASLIRNSSGLQIDICIAEPIMLSLDENEQLALYRIIQEQLNNIVKHADATRILIKLDHKQDTAILHIKDDGRGFNPRENRHGIGLSNIQSRVEMLAGTFEIISAPGHGCELIIQLPCNYKAHQVA